MNALFADTSYFLALLIPTDAAHASALTMAKSLRQPLLTTDWVIVEMGNYLRTGQLRPLFNKWLTLLRNDSRATIISASSALLDEGISLFQSRPDKDWSLTDCISFTIMRRNGITDALSTDHHFRQAGFVPLLADQGSSTN